MACELAMERAIERAGNRLKGRAGVLRDTLRRVSPMEAAMVAGPALIADAGLDADQLLAGSWDDLVVKYQTWANEATDEALGVMGTLVGEWRTGYPSAMKATLAAHLDDSAVYLQQALQGMATQSLFDPKAILYRTGPDLVPTGFVRHVLGIAGGTADISSSGYAFVALRANGDPIPGLATGPVMTDALKDHGGTVEGYRWVYGPARRIEPFRPHQALDGKVFQTFTDPVLLNSHGWPPVSHYIPGDHGHCRCDFEPIVLTNEQAKALGLKVPDVAPVEAPIPAAPAPVVEAPVEPAAPAPAPKVQRAPLSPLGRAAKGAPKYGDAVKAAGKNSVRVNEFAFDGPDVERMGVGVRRVKLSTGPGDLREATEYRMKLTDGGSRRWRERMTAASPDWRRAEQRYLEQSTGKPLDTSMFDGSGRDRGVAWESNGWKAKRGANFQRIDMDGHRAPTIFQGENFVSPNGGYFSLQDGASTFTRELEIDGRKVTVEYVDAAMNGGPFSLRNQVKVFVEGAAPDEALFARVMRELDLVGDVRYPAPADVRALAEDSLLTRLGSKRPYLMSSSERAKELKRIVSEYGVTPKDLDITLGANGQVSVRLNEVAQQALVDRTGNTWFHAQLSAASPEDLIRLMGSGEDGLAATTRRFNDGVGGFGMSSSSDIRTGGADYVFTRQQHYGELNPDRIGLGQVVVRNTRLRDLDWHAYEGDKFGVVADGLGREFGATYGTHDFVAALTKGTSGGQETMFRGLISWDDVEMMGVGSKQTKEQIVAELKRQGITKLGNRKVDELLTYPGEGRTGVHPAVKPRKLYPDDIAARIDAGQALTIDDLATLTTQGAQTMTDSGLVGLKSQLNGMSTTATGDGSNLAKLKNYFWDAAGVAASDPFTVGHAGVDQALSTAGWTWGDVSKMLSAPPDGKGGWIGAEFADNLAWTVEVVQKIATGQNSWHGMSTDKAVKNIVENFQFFKNSLPKP